MTSADKATHKRYKGIQIISKIMRKFLPWTTSTALDFPLFIFVFPFFDMDKLGRIRQLHSLLRSTGKSAFKSIKLLSLKVIFILGVLLVFKALFPVVLTGFP